MMRRGETILFAGKRMTCALSAAALMSLSGCTGSRWAAFADIEPEGWPPAHVVEFHPEADSTNLRMPYDVILCLRYREAIASPAACLRIEEEALDAGFTPTATGLSIPLLDGPHPLGRGNRGLYEVYDTLRRDFIIPEGYAVAISPIAGKPLPRGVINAGIVLSPSSQP